MIQPTSDTQPHLRQNVGLSVPMWRELAVLAGLCTYFLFYGLASFGLVGADEPRYAQIAREMLARHDWVVPILHGKLWLEKPILYYWQAMVSYSVFGVSDWAARLPGAFDAAAMVFATYFFVRRFRRGLQLDAGLILLSMAAVIGFGRAASTDMPLSAAFTIGMLSWATWHETGHAKWLAFFYAFMGVGMLAKGPVAPFLAALIIVIFAAIRRDWRLILRTLWLPGVLLFLVIALPWYVAVQIRVPEFFRTFILQQNFARFGSNLYRHSQPVWYYAPVLLLALLPWTVLAVAGFVDGIRNSGRRLDHPRTSNFNLLFVIWAVVPVMFFSFSGSKLPGYILPAVPAWALLITQWLHGQLSEGKRGNFRLILGHFVLAGFLLSGALLSAYFAAGSKPAFQGYVVAALFAGLVTIVMVALFFLRGLPVLRFATLIPVVIGLAFVLRVAAPIINARQSARPVAQALEKLGHGDAPVVGWDIRREVEYGLAFYLNRPIALYGPVQDTNPDHVIYRGTGEHLLVVGPRAKMVTLPGVRAYWLGSYPAQHLNFYWVVPSAQAY